MERLDLLVNHKCLGNSDGRRSTAEVSFSGDDLVVVLTTKGHSITSPSVEMARNVDTAANRSSGGFLWVPDTPELLECSRTVDGRSVVSPGGKYVVPTAITCDGALQLCSGRRVVRAVRLDDIVLDENIASPTVDGQVAIIVGVVGS